MTGRVPSLTAAHPWRTVDLGRWLGIGAGFGWLPSDTRRQTLGDLRRTAEARGLGARFT